MQTKPFLFTALCITGLLFQQVNSLTIGPGTDLSHRPSEKDNQDFAAKSNTLAEKYQAFATPKSNNMLLKLTKLYEQTQISTVKDVQIFQQLLAEINNQDMQGTNADSIKDILKQLFDKLTPSMDNSFPDRWKAIAEAAMIAIDNTDLWPDLKTSFAGIKIYEILITHPEPTAFLNREDTAPELVRIFNLLKDTKKTLNPGILTKKQLGSIPSLLNQAMISLNNVILMKGYQVFGTNMFYQKGNDPACEIAALSIAHFFSLGLEESSLAKGIGKGSDFTPQRRSFFTTIQNFLISNYIISVIEKHRKNPQLSKKIIDEIFQSHTNALEEIRAAIEEKDKEDSIYGLKAILHLLQYSTINIWENRAINKFIEEIIIEEAGKDKIGLGKTNFTKTKDPEIIKLFLEIASTTLNDLKILYILTPKQRDKIEDLFAKASQQSIINTRQQN